MWALSQGLPTRRRAIAAFVGAGLGAACGGTRGPAGASMLQDAAEHYVRLTLRIAQHQPSLVEAWNGPREWLPGPRRPVAALRDDAEALGGRLRQLEAEAGESPRYTYLVGQVGALNVAVRRLAGESMTFADEARAALALSRPAWHAASDARASARAALDRTLPGPGALHERVNAWRQRHALGPALIEKAFAAAIDACRERAARWVPLPRDERVTLVRASGLGAEARAVWTGGRSTELRLDDRAAPDVAHLVWLAAHESYAGHHLQHLLAADNSMPPAVPVERQLQPAFGPHLLHAEGAAEAGTALLLAGSAFADACGHVCQTAGCSAEDVTAQIAVHRAQLAVDLAIPQVAEDYLDGRIGQAEATERLAGEGLVADAASFLGVIERQRTRVLAYPVGRRLVTQALGSGPPETRWIRLRRIAATLTIA